MSPCRRAREAGAVGVDDFCRGVDDLTGVLGSAGASAVHALGKAVGHTSIAFVSAAAVANGIKEKYGLDKAVEAVNTEGLAAVWDLPTRMPVGPGIYKTVRKG